MARHKVGYACRCTRRGCRLRWRRVTLRHKPEWYTGAHAWRGRCSACKEPLTVDGYRTSGREDRKTGCDCGNVPFRHRRGSACCEHSALGRMGFSWWDRGREEYMQAVSR